MHSCSVQELVREGKRSRTRAARPMKVLPNLLLYFMCEKWSALMASFLKSGLKEKHKASFQKSGWKEKHKLSRERL